MIISEKQIMLLINYVKDASKHTCFNHTDFQKSMCDLLNEVYDQQSDELKNVD